MANEIKLLSGEFLQGKSVKNGTEVVFSSRFGRLKGVVVESSKKGKFWASSGMVTCLGNYYEKEDVWRCVGCGHVSKGTAHFEVNDELFLPKEVQQPPPPVVVYKGRKNKTNVSRKRHTRHGRP